MNLLKFDRSWVEIDLGQIITNYKEYCKNLPQGVEVMAVIKADAYGHDAVAVAKALRSAGVKKFAVSNLSEAIELRDAGIDSDLLILGYTSALFAKELCEYNLTQTIVSEEHAKKICEQSTERVACQFAIDTGMNRIGLDADDADECARIIRKYSKYLNINGIFTHFCVADSIDEDDVAFTLSQINKFKAVCDKISDLDLPYVHCSNSAAGLFYSDEIGVALSRNGMVRLGIVLYGLKPDISNRIPKNILPALSWKTVVSTVKTVRSGEYVGYGRTYRADKDIKVATLSTGYADGYSRALSNKGYVLIHGKRARIIGNVCMDQMMVDVTDIPSVKMGDFATLIGMDGNDMITADDLASLIGTIGYEIVCGISKRVQRKINK